jgi:hypothetical protein
MMRWCRIWWLCSANWRWREESSAFSLLRASAKLAQGVVDAPDPPLAPTLLFYVSTGSNLLLALGMVIFVFDLIYIGMLYQRFRALGLNPFTRRLAPLT